MIFFQMVTALGIIIGGIWALIRYINERGSVTAVEFDIECKMIGETEKQKIVEFTVIVNNKGPLVLIVEAIFLRLRTIRAAETQGNLEMFDWNKEKKKQARLKFPHKHTVNPNTKDKVKLVPFITFVKPGVRQKYPFVTAFEKQDEFVFAQTDLKYGRSTKRWWQYAVLNACKRFGLRKHIITEMMQRPQTAERAFNIQGSPSK